ncbi:hypothetical protein [Thiocapsa bogorovii]|nr:hypothetical protein [Thiocapsa bogorovii]
MTPTVGSASHGLAKTDGIGDGNPNSPSNGTTKIKNNFKNNIMNS